MTENAAYPLFLVTLWLIGRVVRSPGALGQLSALGSICLLTMTRTQGAVLLPVLVVAAAAYALMLESGVRRSYLTRFVPTGVVVVAVTLIAAVVEYGGRGGNEALGGRSGVVGAVALAEVPGQIALHVGGLLLTVAVLPALASLVMIVRRPLPQRHRASAPLRCDRPPDPPGGGGNRQSRRNGDRHRRRRGHERQIHRLRRARPPRRVRDVVRDAPASAPRSHWSSWSGQSCSFLSSPTGGSLQMRPSTHLRLPRGSPCRTRLRRSRSELGHSVSGSRGSGSAKGRCALSVAHGLVAGRHRVHRSGRPPALRAQRCHPVRRVTDVGSRRGAGRGGRPRPLAHEPWPDRRRGLLRPDDDRCPEPVRRPDPPPRAVDALRERRAHRLRRGWATAASLSRLRAPSGVHASCSSRARSGSQVGPGHGLRTGAGPRSQRRRDQGRRRADVPAAPLRVRPAAATRCAASTPERTCRPRPRVPAASATRRRSRSPTRTTVRRGGATPHRIAADRSRPGRARGRRSAARRSVRR